MVHTKTIKIVLFTIDSRLSASQKCGGKEVFLKYSDGGESASPQTISALQDSAVFPFQV